MVIPHAEFEADSGLLSYSFARFLLSADRRCLFCPSSQRTISRRMGRRSSLRATRRCDFLSHCLYQILTDGIQYYGKPFRVALWDQWMVVVSGTKMIDDLRKRPDDEFSFQEGLEQVCRRMMSTRQCYLLLRYTEFGIRAHDRKAVCRRSLPCGHHQGQVDEVHRRSVTRHDRRTQPRCARICSCT